MIAAELVNISQQHLILTPRRWNNELRIPALGTNVLTKENIIIGHVTDVIGPVKKPIFTITLIKGEVLIDFKNLLEPLYIDNRKPIARKPRSDRKKGNNRNTRNTRNTSNTRNTRNSATHHRNNNR